ncbi:MAG: hypothetical protein V7631_942 [Massilia sp.]|jgi:hypothetical protein
MDLHIDKATPAGAKRALAPLRPFLAFLRQRLPLLLVWPALALTAAAVLWGYVLLDLEHERRSRQAEPEQQVDAYTRSWSSARAARSPTPTGCCCCATTESFQASGSAWKARLTRALSPASTLQAWECSTARASS